MRFHYSRQGLTAGEKRLERLFEMVPGLTSWALLIGTSALSLLDPFLAAILIIIFDLYWLFRIVYMTLFLLLAYGRLTAEKETPWMELAAGLHEPRELLRGLTDVFRKTEVRSLCRSSMEAPPPRVSEIVHLVLIPIVRETRQVIEPGIAALARQTFPSRQIIVVLAVEERATDTVKKEAEETAREYRGAFMELRVITHPTDLPGEARVKGANVTHAAKQAAALFEQRGVSFDRVVVSCFDADTVVNDDYLACLTYYFMVSPDRTRASFQPIPVYHNNIWDVPGFARVLDVGSSFFQLIEATNPDKLVTFSSHSMSFKALVEVGYWPLDMISDDSAIFWKSFIHFDGRYRVVPMYITLSMDVVAAETWWKTAAAVYRQKRRWAWGVENFPIVMRAFLRRNGIPLHLKFRHAFKMFEGHIGWATWPFLLAVIGWLPAIFAGQEFSSSVLYYSAPRIATTVFRLASFSLAASIILSILLLPKKKSPFGILKKIRHGFEWLLVPLVAVFLGALPALDAQTRLARGRYMEFWVSPKKRGLQGEGNGDRLTR